MKIELKDGAVRSYDNPVTVVEIAKELSEGLARVACAGVLNGNIVDLRYTIDEDCNLSILTFADRKSTRLNSSH